MTSITNVFKGLISREKNPDKLADITYEAFKDDAVSMRMYDKIVEYAVKRENKLRK